MFVGVWLCSIVWIIDWFSFVLGGWVVCFGMFGKIGVCILVVCFLF